MKKFLYMAVAAIAVLSSCSNDDIASGDDGKNANAPVFSATIDGVTSLKTVLADGGTKVNWLSTDEVSINGTLYAIAPGNPATTATLTKKTASDASPASPYKAYYPASMYNAGTASLPATYTYDGNFNMPMYAESSETSLAFKNICAVLAITVPSTQMSSVTSITVSSDKQMNGAFTATAAGVLTFADKTLEDADKQVTLTFSEAKAIASSETFYIAIPANTYGYLQIQVTDGTNTKMMKTDAASISVARNTIYPITFAKNYDTNLLAGVFSVSATKKVKFTKGNLWCNATTTPVTWAFETNQYDYLTDWNTSHVGLFFWNSYDEYITTTNGYKPYDSSYGHLNTRSTSDVFWCGQAHPLEVAGTQGLYVLSSDEWYYLTGMFTYVSYEEDDVRNETNKFAKARVNGKAGLLIFPDGYNGTTVLTGITGMCTVNEDYADAYPDESIPTATWTGMEAAGVVFLPAAGYRGDPNGQTITSGNCYYWSSTPNSIKEKANGLSGKGQEFTCPGIIQRNFGSSIRLVKTVE